MLVTIIDTRWINIIIAYPLTQLTVMPESERESRHCIFPLQAYPKDPSLVTRPSDGSCMTRYRHARAPPATIFISPSRPGRAAAGLYS